MEFYRSGFGGYALGDYYIHNDTEHWYIQKDLDSRQKLFLADTLEEAIEWILEQEDM